MEALRDPERGSLFAKLGLGACFVVGAILYGLAAFDVAVPEETVVASVVLNLQYARQGKSTDNQVQLRLPSGALVTARASANSGFPFPKGAQVRVTAYKGRIFGVRTYRLSP